MRILLLHPEDSPRRGPWTRQHWDLIVDIGKSSPFSAAEWEASAHCPVLPADRFRKGLEDVRRVRKILSAGQGHLVDKEDIDWWDLCVLIFAAEVETAICLQRLVREIRAGAELWATRCSQSLSILECLLHRPILSFRDTGWARSVQRARHYAGLVRHFSAAQVKEIVFDKYDAGYRWRSRIAANPNKCSEPVVLVPSAYGNVSRMASAYACLLPEQDFLMVATRGSAKQFVAPCNMQTRDLASYAIAGTAEGEIASLTSQWLKLKGELKSIPELRVLIDAGVLNAFPNWIRDGLGARDAWRQVLQREPVCGVLCGDDSNLYTRLPVLLAARRGIPTLDFHHGALDGNYLLKDPPCDLYLAKNVMERDYLLRICGLPAGKIVIGAPRVEPRPPVKHGISEARSAILFSEPYEVAGMRAEEVYRELVPELCRVARQNGRTVVIKLHPFESRAQRRKIVQQVLSFEDAKFVTVVDGPLSAKLLATAWFGITIESTTVIDCLQNGVCCFLCGWLSLSSFEYAQQYVRFGIGELLDNINQVAEIPGRLSQFQNRVSQTNFSSTVDPAVLRGWLTTSQEPAGARSAS